MSLAELRSTTSCTSGSSSVPNINRLQQNYNHLVGREVVFGTPNYEYALAMAIDSTNDDLEVGYINGQFTIAEVYAGAFELLKEPSYIYEMKSNGFHQHPRLPEMEYIIEASMPVLKSKRVPNTYKELKRLGRPSYHTGDNMDLRPRQSKHLVTGKDGTRIYTVEPSVWKAHIEYIHKKHNISEWYMQPSFKWIYEHTKIGYYPRGLAIEKAKEIYVMKGAETDYSLLAHEYGHILGHGHVPDGIPI